MVDFWFPSSLPLYLLRCAQQRRRGEAIKSTRRCIYKKNRPCGALSLICCAARSKDGAASQYKLPDDAYIKKSALRGFLMYFSLRGAKTARPASTNIAGCLWLKKIGPAGLSYIFSLREANAARPNDTNSVFEGRHTNKQRGAFKKQHETHTLQSIPQHKCNSPCGTP